jgi:hypothetical protein
MNIPLLSRWLRNRRNRFPEDNRDDLDVIATYMVDSYASAVADGEMHDVLVESLTGLAGCHLAMSSTLPAMGENDGEANRIAGLLALELSYCARERMDYRGVRTFEFQTETIAQALRNVALAYAGWAPNPYGNLAPPPEAPVPVGIRLNELWDAIAEQYNGRTADIVLVPLMEGAHDGDFRTVTP